MRHARNAQPVAIAGGGIGGLACALALARQGFRSLVLEQAREFGEVGVGLHVAPNALSVLDALGVGAAAKKNALMIERLLMMDAVTGEEVANIPCGARFERALRQSLCGGASRRTSTAPLLDACRAHELIELRTDSRVTDFELEGSGVSVALDGGERIAAAALIGADGVYSNVRKRIVGDGDPLPAGAIIFRATIPAAEMPKDLQHPYPTFWAGPDWHMIYYPISDWTMFNLGCTVLTGQAELQRGRGIRARRGAAVFRRRLRNSDARAAHSEKIPPLHHRAPRAGRELDHGRRRRCSATPRIRWCSTSRRAPRWRWRTRSASPACADECDGDFATRVPALPGHPHRAHRAGADFVDDDEQAQPRQGRRAEGAQFAVRGPHAGGISTTAWRGSTPRRLM